MITDTSLPNRWKVGKLRRTWCLTQGIAGKWRTEKDLQDSELNSRFSIV